MKASAVCRFSLSDVQKAFEGPYMESQNSGFKWKEYTGKIPDPRPGTVNTHIHTETGTVSVIISLTQENHNRECLKLIKGGSREKEKDIR